MAAVVIACVFMCLWTISVCSTFIPATIGAHFTDLQTGEKTTSIRFPCGKISSVCGHFGNLSDPVFVKRDLAWNIMAVKGQP